MKEGEERFKDEAYYHNVINILNRFADFANDVSQLYYQKIFFSAENIQENFQKLLKKFDTCINDLHFAVSIVHYEQQHMDKQKIEFDLKNIMEYLQKINDKLDLNIQEMKMSLEKETSNIHKTD
ncbi:kinase-like protein [Gigaspora margarita]|uniref:Kinase-like protein n=1 Tax=Gigaspora margarita TaxID=4874 RepID=A0A8H3XCJ5_GIGMA|nr:kinase-like protein [Gigaspora margarita]